MGGDCHRPCRRSSISQIVVVEDHIKYLSYSHSGAYRGINARSSVKSRIELYPVVQSEN